MRRIVGLVLLVLLAVSSKAHAAALIPYGSQSNYCGGSGTSCNTATVPTYANVNDGIVICVNTWAGTAETGMAITINGSATGISAWGSRIAQTNSTTTCFHKTLIAGDAGSAIHASWTNNNQSEVLQWAFHPSDNVAPTYETPATVGCASTTTCTPSTVTPAQNGDLVFTECGLAGGSPHWLTGTLPYQTYLGTALVSGVFGWGASSGSPTMSAANSTAGAVDITCFTGAVAASGSGSAVVAAGAIAYNSGSVTLSQPTVTSYAHSSDVSFAGVETIGSAQTVYPMPQTGGSASTLAFSAKSATGSFTINAGAAAGQLVVTCAYSGSALTPPSGFAAICSDSANFASECAYKVIVSGDVGATKTWTGGSPNVFYTDWSNAGGTGWAIDPNSSCGSAGSANNANAPALTTLSNNEMALVATNQGGSFTVTKPSGTTLALSAGAPNNNTAGYVNQTSPGSIGTQNFTSTGSQTWELESIGIIRLTGSSTWTAITPKANESGTAQMSVFWNTGLAASSTQTFVTTTAVSIESVIVNVAGLNTTPVDGTVGLVGNEGLAHNTAAPVAQATANDDLALLFTGSATSGPGAPQAVQLPQNITFGSRMTVDYDAIDFALGSLIVGSMATPYVSVAIPLQAASAPAQTSASLRLQQQIEEIFSLAPAPSGPSGAGGWFF
jgi:hypothetical protein